MFSDYFGMVTENIEGYKEFNIKKDWYKNRKKRLSALIRCYGDELWIGAFIESCLPLFDEIVVVIDETINDISEKIINSFTPHKIKTLKYFNNKH